MRFDSTLKGELVGGTYVASDHKYAKVVERQTLKRLCPTVVTLIKSLPRTLELQEPTFKDIVVLYRRAIPKPDPSKAGGAEAAAGNPPSLAERNIFIKVFGETPMADVEIIFPSKRVGFKPFQLVNLVITVVMALVSGILVLLQAGRNISMNIIWTAASLILGRCFQVYTQAQAQKSQMQNEMSSQLYDKMQDSQEGVVSAIMSEMADQQFKQMLLAYTMLLLKDKPLKEEDLDGLCEEFLVRDFDHRIDFQVLDSLPRLERWGLVFKNDQGKLQAMPLENAIEVLSFAWAVAYRSVGGATNAGVPTADLMSGRGSAFGPELDSFRQAKAAELKAQGAGARAFMEKARETMTFGRARSSKAAAAAAAYSAPPAGPTGPSTLAPASGTAVMLEPSESGVSPGRGGGGVLDSGGSIGRGRASVELGSEAGGVAASIPEGAESGGGDDVPPSVTGATDGGAAASSVAEADGDGSLVGASVSVDEAAPGDGASSATSPRASGGGGLGKKFKKPAFLKRLSTSKPGGKE